MKSALGRAKSFSYLFHAAKLMHFAENAKLSFWIFPSVCISMSKSDSFVSCPVNSILYERATNVINSGDKITTISAYCRCRFWTKICLFYLKWGKTNKKHWNSWEFRRKKRVFLKFRKTAVETSSIGFKNVWNRLQNLNHRRCLLKQRQCLLKHRRCFNFQGDKS